MKIAVLGAGFTGLTAAYKLARVSHQIFVFEKRGQPGGLARGFKLSGWEWFLEKSYHHLFASDQEAFKLIKEVGLSNKLFFKKPVTAVYYKPDKREPRKHLRGGRLRRRRRQSHDFSDGGRASPPCSARARLRDGEKAMPAARGIDKHETTPSNIYPLDTPLNLLFFPHLSLADKIRSGLALAYLKLNPRWQNLERIPAKDWIEKTMGKQAWRVLWEPLFINKFGKFASKVPASWFWARIKKRSRKLGYLQGSFQILADKLVEKIENLGGKVYLNHEIKKIALSKEKKFSLRCKKGNSGRCDRTFKSYHNKGGFDKVVATLPTSIFLKIIDDLPKDYIKQLTSVKHLNALTLILELKEPFLKKTYWLNVCNASFPFLLLVEQTNFVDPCHYGGHHILYIGNYLPPAHQYFSKSKEELLKIFLPYLKKINPSFATRDTQQATRFISKYAQPVFPLNYSRVKPGFATPLPDLFLANQDQIYPWDRGVNYAIKLGKEVATQIIKINQGCQ